MPASCPGFRVRPTNRVEQVRRHGPAWLALAALLTALVPVSPARAQQHHARREPVRHAVAAAQPAPAPAVAPPAPPPQPAPPQPPPAITLSPTINVPPASISVPPAVVTVQAPPGGFWRTWLPVLIAGLAAFVAATSAWLSWRNQLYGVAKDAAATARDGHMRRSAAALAAFENSVARPLGMALDRIEEMMLELGRLRPILPPAPPSEPPPSGWMNWRREKERLRLPPPGPSPREAALEEFSRVLVADGSHGLRLCREADEALANPRQGGFTQRFFAANLEDLLLDAAEQALASNAAAADGAHDAAIKAVVRVKVDLRRMLEEERAAEAQRWSDLLSHDPFFTAVQSWLPRRLRVAVQQVG